MLQVWLGLGGNVGDVRSLMSRSISALCSGGLENIRVSSLYRTPPWGLEDQPWFLNCCVTGFTDLSALELLSLCQRIEHDGARERKIRWGPRTIDIDILFYEGVECCDDELTLPHPRISERAFVLVPLSELSPNLILDGELVSSLASCIDRSGIEFLHCGSDWVDWSH